MEGWGSLPSELLLMIFSHLEARELARLGNVNYHWRRVSEDDSLWKHLFYRDFTRNTEAEKKGWVGSCPNPFRSGGEQGGLTGRGANVGPSKSFTEKKLTRIAQTSLFIRSEIEQVRARWIDEYKLLKVEPPIILTESLRDCPDGLAHVAFSNDGQLFCTTACDASFKIWTATSPVYLLDERYMDDALGWERTLSSQFSVDNKRLLVLGVKFGGNGEIAVYSIDGWLLLHLAFTLR
ncbi:unnamed protein product [Gongylonema pulchrum]|uniref:F-box domain-containing protein n=1 Tax=Gongylonema pulchrum TaxID=637853 RepID=A0A183D6L0_9BILA|nr:unnamed protein product [Gongylonema pulchrum]